MKTENRPHMLNGHEIYIHRDIRGTSNAKNYKNQRNIRTLHVFFHAKSSNVPKERELKSHFEQYGKIINIGHSANNVKITYDE